MRVQVDDRPRMESTSTSSVARRAAIWEYLLFHLSSPASAAALSGEFAITISGIFTRGGFFAADLAREKLRKPGTGEQNEERDEREHQQVGLTHGTIGSVQLGVFEAIDADFALLAHHIGNGRGETMRISGFVFAFS